MLSDYQDESEAVRERDLIGMMDVSGGDEKKSITADSTVCIPVARTSFFFFFLVFFSYFFPQKQTKRERCAIVWPSV